MNLGMAPTGAWMSGVLFWQAKANIKNKVIILCILKNAKMMTQRIFR